MRTEAEIAEDLCGFFKSVGWDYRREWVTKSGKAIDFLVKAPYEDGHIFFGVECKKDLGHNTNASVLADHLEQASAYAKDLDMPVFLAPIMTKATPSDLFLGSKELDNLSALNIFGGRFNVGTLVRQERWWYGQKQVQWFSILRGGIFWDYRGFNSKRLNTVCSLGSEKKRKGMKIWK
jgi:hypothetical protein